MADNLFQSGLGGIDTEETNDNRVIRSNGTQGRAIQGSGVTLDDSDAISGLTQLDVDNLRADGNTISSTDTDGDINLTPDGAGKVNVDGNLNVLAQQELRLQDSTGGEYLGFRAPTTLSGNQTFTLPDGDGSASQFLQTNGSGVLSWATAGNNLTVSSESSNFNAIANRFYVVDTSSADVTATLPAAASNSGEVIILILDDDTNTLIIDDIGGDNLELDNLNEYAVVRSDGTNWRILGTNKAPTVQTLTSGSGATYTTPAHVTKIVVEAVGAGGGGGGSRVGAGTAGGTGGNGTATTFGIPSSTTLISAGGGIGGANTTVAAAGSGGTSSVSSPAITLVEEKGAGGDTGTYCIDITIATISGRGGQGAFGHQPRSIAGGTVAGTTADANSGAGGTGGGCVQTSNTCAPGNGGGAGGYVKALIAAPDATYEYTIGSGGTGGTAGNAGAVGGAGGSGVIIVTEYY